MSCCRAVPLFPSAQVALFHRVPDKATGVPAWVYLDRKQPHTHDVRSLAVLTRPDSHPMLISGGNDGQLVLYSLDRFLKEHPTRQSKSPQVPLLQLSCGRHPARLLHVHQHTLSIWQLGRAVQQQPLYGTEAGEAALGLGVIRVMYVRLIIVRTGTCLETRIQTVVLVMCCRAKHASYIAWAKQASWCCDCD